MVLAQNIVENLGSIFSGKDLIAHIYNVARICPVPQESEQPAALQSFQPGRKMPGALYPSDFLADPFWNCHVLLGRRDRAWAGEFCRGKQDRTGESGIAFVAIVQRRK